MRILNSLYPYPVLSVDHEDYKNGSSFEVAYSLSEATSFKKAKLSARFNLVDSSIGKLIDSGKAGIFLHVESPRAAYRKIYRVENDFLKIEIDPENMRTLVEVTGFILATDSIDNYVNPSVNEDLYGAGYVFPNLEAGDPLAVSFTVEIELDEIDDFAQVSSIIKVARTKEKQMKVDYGQDTIFFYLPVKKTLAFSCKQGGVLMLKTENVLDTNQDYITFSQVREAGVPYSVIRKKLDYGELENMKEASIGRLKLMLMNYFFYRTVTQKVFIRLKLHYGYTACCLQFHLNP